MTLEDRRGTAAALAASLAALLGGCHALGVLPLACGADENCPHDGRCLDGQCVYGDGGDGDGDGDSPGPDGGPGPTDAGPDGGAGPHDGGLRDAGPPLDGGDGGDDAGCLDTDGDGLCDDVDGMPCVPLGEEVNLLGAVDTGGSAHLESLGGIGTIAPFYSGESPALVVVDCTSAAPPYEPYTVLCNAPGTEDDPDHSDKAAIDFGIRFCADETGEVGDACSVPHLPLAQGAAGRMVIDFGALVTFNELRVFPLHPSAEGGAATIGVRTHPETTALPPAANDPLWVPLVSPAAVPSGVADSATRVTSPLRLVTPSTTTRFLRVEVTNPGQAFAGIRALKAYDNGDLDDDGVCDDDEPSQTP